MADSYVIAMTDQTIMQIVLHMISIIIMVGFLATSIYVLVLVIKLARRGIRALDIYNDGKRSYHED